MTLRYEWLPYESGIERDVIVCIDASGQTRRMGVQAGPYRWQDVHGVWHDHYFDLVHEQHDGRIVFTVVRPETSASYEELEAILPRLKRDDPRLADAAVRLVGRAHCPDWLVQQSNAIRRAWRSPDPDADACLLGYLRRTHAPVRIDVAGRACGLGSRALACVGRLLITDLVAIDPTTTLVDASLVRAVSIN